MVNIRANLYSQRERKREREGERGQDKNVKCVEDRNDVVVLLEVTVGAEVPSGMT